MIRNVSATSDGGPAGGRRTRRWLVLAAGTVALTAGSTFQYGLAYLIPALRAGGLSLAQAGVIVACPTAGLLLTLVAWGAAADRWGERRILAAGLGIAGLVLLAAARARSMATLGACLVVAGAAGASVYAASRQKPPRNANANAAASPRVASEGRASAATATPSGCALCLMPIASPRSRAANQPRMSRPLAA